MGRFPTKYSPGTSAGQRLLAHELVHTVQQGEAQQPEVALRQATGGSDRKLQISAKSRPIGLPPDCGQVNCPTPESQGLPTTVTDPHCQDASKRRCSHSDIFDIGTSVTDTTGQCHATCTYNAFDCDCYDEIPNLDYQGNPPKRPWWDPRNLLPDDWTRPKIIGHYRVYSLDDEHEPVPNR